jgi:hypothetical protein
MCILKSKWEIGVVLCFVLTAMILVIVAVNLTFIDTEQLRASLSIYRINEHIDAIAEKHFTLVTVIYMIVYIVYVL